MRIFWQKGHVIYQINILIKINSPIQALPLSQYYISITILHVASLRNNKIVESCFTEPQKENDIVMLHKKYDGCGDFAYIVAMA